MKRSLTFMAAPLIALALLAGCGDSEDGGTGNTEPATEETTNKGGLEPGPDSGGAEAQPDDGQSPEGSGAADANREPDTGDDMQAGSGQ